MTSTTDATPRYRNFSNNMPASTNATPRAPSSSLITVEKEPERDPEEDCFMCRQAHVYVKPIGMQQERRVARLHPPPLTRAEMDELSRKKHLTKQEARKLLQCYFPEIKGVKYFQLHKYHSCCYDPKHLKLCKNHITALQRERDQHPDHHHHHHDHQNGDKNNENHYKDFEREKGQQNRVSFVRIKIEPTKGIPTRFLGPAALPESLADMLIKQVNHLEDKTPTSIYDSNQLSKQYQVRRIADSYDDIDEVDEDEDDDDDDDEEDDGDENNQQGTVKSQKTSANGDLAVDDFDETNGSNPYQFTLPKIPKGKNSKKGTKKRMGRGHRKPKLKHWELMALEQAKQEPCTCRHHVMRLEADHIIYDWCRCKDHQHKDLLQKHGPPGHPMPLPPRRKPLKALPPPPSEKSTPTPPPPPPPAKEPTPLPPPPPPQPKPRKVRKRSIGIDATDQSTTQIALAYDPAAVDYDMVQEVIYYRTSSGRLIKPEITNAFTYDSIPPALQSMTINPDDPIPHKAEVLYMSPGGQLLPYESGGRRRGKAHGHSTAGKSAVLTYPGSLYGGQVVFNTDNGTSRSLGSATMPVLRLPPSVASSRRSSSNNKSNHGYQATEFTLAKFSSDKNGDSPSSRGSAVSGSQHSITSDSQGIGRHHTKSKQRSTKPTYSNLEPTPDYGRQSSVVANRRWFDQPLGDQNLRPVHDGQYGLIAGTSTGQYPMKSQLASNNYTEDNPPKTGSNCKVS